MTIAIVTVANKWPSAEYYCHREWLKSVERHGFHPTILGMDQEWKGLMSKPRHLRKWLRDGKCTADCMIFTDSFDLVFAASPNVIAAQWEVLGRPWIMSTERHLFPNDIEEKRFPVCGTSYRFPNSGVIIASPSDMLAVLEAMDLDSIPDDHQKDDGTVHHGNDQLEFQRIFLKQPIPMRLDTQCQFAWSLCGVDASNFEFLDNGTIVNRETGTAPCILHLNGPAKTSGMREPILKHLGLC